MFFFNGPNGSSCSQRFISNIQIRGITECPFISNVFWWSQRKTPTALFTFLPGLSFPLFQNKLDFSPGSSVQGNPLEKGPGSGRYLFCWLRGIKKKEKIHGGEWARDKDLCSGALQGHFHSVKAVPPDWPPSRLEVCAPPGGRPDGGLALF